MLFLSHAREDAAAAARVEQLYRDMGKVCVRDPQLVEGDPFWREKIRELLRQCRGLIALDSPAAACSPWVEQERRAFDGPVRRVPVDGLDPAWPDVGPASDVDSEVATVRRGLVDAQWRWLDEVRREYQGRPGILSLAGVSGAASDGSEIVALPGRADEQGPYLGAEPVTNAQYERFLAEIGHPPPPTWQRDEHRRPDAPVTGVTWFEAMAYAAYAGASLPTEEEWMRAAGGGLDTCRDGSVRGEFRPEGVRCGEPFGVGAPRPARDRAPNGAGFFGMSGNTWDWCITADGDHRVIKGGGWMDAASFCTVRSSLPKLTDRP